MCPETMRGKTHTHIQELQIIKIAHLQNKWEMQRFHFFRCQLCYLPHALLCHGFCSTSPILKQRSVGSGPGSQSPTGSAIGAARRDF